MPCPDFPRLDGGNGKSPLAKHLVAELVSISQTYALVFLVLKEWKSSLSPVMEAENMSI